MHCHLAGESLWAGCFLPSDMWPTCPCHWGSELPRVPCWVDILVCGQGCPLRPRHVSTCHILQGPLPISSSLYCTESLPLTPWLAHSSPSQATPSPTITAQREAALGWVAICTFYEYISVTSALQQGWWMRPSVSIRYPG